MEKISVYPKAKWHTHSDGQTVQKLLQKQGYIHNCNYFRKANFTPSGSILICAT